VGFHRIGPEDALSYVRAIALFAGVTAWLIVPAPVRGQGGGGSGAAGTITVTVTTAATCGELLLPGNHACGSGGGSSARVGATVTVASLLPANAAVTLDNGGITTLTGSNGGSLTISVVPYEVGGTIGPVTTIALGGVGQPDTVFELYPDSFDVLATTPAGLFEGVGNVTVTDL